MKIERKLTKEDADEWHYLNEHLSRSQKGQAVCRARGYFKK